MNNIKLLSYLIHECHLFLNPMLSVLYSLLEVLIVLIPVLLAVAFMTIIERKVLAAMQRRVGPNTVGVYGILQPFLRAALKNNDNKQNYMLGHNYMLLSAGKPTLNDHTFCIYIGLHPTRYLFHHP